MASRFPLATPLLLSFCFAACGGSETPSTSGTSNAGGAGPDRRPVILISIDSLRADHSTPYGYHPQFAPEQDTMPFLDRLGREGVVFENAEATAPWTLASHMSILTGMHPVEHGVRSRKFSLDPNIDLVSSVFQRADYATAGFFSAPFLHPVWGFHKGFDVYAPGPAYLGTLDAAAALATSGKGENVEKLHHESHTDNRTGEQVVDRALKWLADDQQYQQPFFLFLHFWDPHYDYFPPDDYRAQFLPEDNGKIRGDEFMDLERELSSADLDQLKALYDAEIRYTDDQIARLWAQLEEWGIADDVIIGITSDHGDEFLEHGERGHHLTLYEEVMHVPMVIHAQGLLPEGTRIHGSVSNRDLAPTLIDLAGLPAWTDRSGHSLATMWREQDVDQDVIMDLLRPTRRIEMRGYRFGDAKGILDSFRRSYTVFDLASDPGEEAPKVGTLTDKQDPFAVRSLAVFEDSQKIRHKVGKVAETAEMTDLLSELGYTDSVQEVDPPKKD